MEMSLWKWLGAMEVGSEPTRRDDGPVTYIQRLVLFSTRKGRNWYGNIK